MRNLLLGVCLLVAASSAAKSEAHTQTTQLQPQPPRNAQDDRAKALERIRALPWKNVDELKLPASRATLADLPGFAGLAGDDARTFRAIVDGRIDPSVEGDVIRRSNSSEILFSWNAVGYVDAKDFPTSIPTS